MAAKALPARPSLEQYKKQAKELLKKLRAADPAAKIALADAQFVIAREHGFDSWPKFAKHIEAAADKHSPIAQFESAVDAVVAGDVTILKRLLRQNQDLIRARSTRPSRPS